MAVTTDKSAPYAPPRAVLDIIDRYRSRGLPSPINSEVLARAGVVSESLTPRTLQTLQALDLIDEGGNPTPTFEGLRIAPQSELQQCLSDWLRAVYADVFSFVDPTTDDDTRIRDAFRSYKPIGQQDRMVTLFTGLCARAGLMPEKTPRAAPSHAPANAPRSRASNRQTATLQSKRKQPPDLSSSAHLSGAIPAPLAGLLATLPPADIGWTKTKRDSFVSTFGAVLDFCFPIVGTAMEDGEEEDGGA